MASDQGRRANAKPASAVKDTADLMGRELDRRAQQVFERYQAQLSQMEARMAQAQAAQTEQVMRASAALERLVAEAMQRIRLNTSPPPQPPPPPVRYSVTADQMLEIFRRITDSVGRGHALTMDLFMQHLDEVLRS